MKAQTSIDPKLISMLGKKLYSGDPLPILVRELMQNAWDACKRRGVDPDVIIDLTFAGDDNEKCVVTCIDNGIGMTDEQIVNDFLCLGGTGKSELHETGGFGIAKAAIMSHQTWSVASLDNLVTSTDVYEGRQIRKTNYYEGTIVTVVVEKPKYLNYQCRKVINWVNLSDVDIKLVIKGTYQDYVNEHAGLSAGVRRKPLEATEYWEAWGTDEFTLEDYDGRRDNSIRSTNVFRLNGLVQFTDSGSSDRKTNIFFDITPTCRPQHDDYPLTISREGLKGPANDGVGRLIQAHDINVVQSSHIMREPTRPKIEIVRLRTGYFLKGKRETEYERESDYEKMMSSDMGSKTGSLDLRLEGGRDIDPNDPQANEVALLMDRYESTKETLQRDVSVLRVWEHLISICASDDEYFGIGITLEEYTGASRQVFQGRDYYVINPITPGEIKSLQGRVMFLWARACHECTHFYVSNHNEKFTSIVDRLTGETAGIVASQMSELIRLAGSKP